MLSDIRMPGMTGVELVPRALASNPDLAIVMLTAVNDAPTATEALSRGAMGYLTKPVELPDLHESILKALHRREMLLQQREIDHVIREEVTLRTAELEREKSALRDLTIQVAESLVIAMEAKNPVHARPLDSHRRDGRRDRRRDGSSTSTPSRRCGSRRG